MLNKLIFPMFKETKEIIFDNYSKDKYITFDSPVSSLNSQIMNLYKKNKRIFDNVSQKLSRKIINDININITNQMSSNIGHLSEEAKVKFRLKIGRQYLDALKSAQATIENNVNLIKSIPEEYFKDIITQINQGMALGKNQKELANYIQKTCDVTKKTARLIARDQTFKATSAITNERRLKLGITKAIWRHSSGDKEPRKSHLAANGTEYEISKGCYIDGEYIQPAEKINCTCYSSAVIEI